MAVLVGAVLAALVGQPLPQLQSVLDGCGRRVHQRAVGLGEGAGAGEGALEVGGHVLAAGPGRLYRLRGEPDVGQEALLRGVQVVVAGALVVEPFAQAEAGGGEAAVGAQRLRGRACGRGLGSRSAATSPSTAAATRIGSV